MTGRIAMGTIIGRETIANIMFAYCFRMVPEHNFEDCACCWHFDGTYAISSPALQQILRLVTGTSAASFACKHGNVLSPLCH